MDAVLSVRGLTKRFGSFRAVDGVDIEVNRGDIYGFLGRNGAGKTTTIRSLLRLIRPDEGTIRIFGMDPRTRFIEIMKRTGALVEQPAAYPHLSGTRNLDLLRISHGGIPTGRIGELLEQVGLDPALRTPVRTYSQGMRQRLGIAMALLARPEFVLLDEPTNGLDPQGIHEMRDLIRRLNRDQGVTFLISSHLLHEIQLVCNRVGIIRNGKMILQERVDALLTGSARHVEIECERPMDALEFLKSRDYVESAEVEGDRLRARLASDHFARLNGDLHRKGFAVARFAPERLSLEDFFLSQ